MYLRYGKVLGTNLELQDSASNTNHQSSHFSIPRFANLKTKEYNYSSSLVQGPNFPKYSSTKDPLSLDSIMENIPEDVIMTIAQNFTSAKEQSHSPTSSIATRLYYGFTKIMGRFGF